MGALRAPGKIAGGKLLGPKSGLFSKDIGDGQGRSAASLGEGFGVLGEVSGFSLEAPGSQLFRALVVGQGVVGCWLGSDPVQLQALWEEGLLKWE